MKTLSKTWFADGYVDFELKKYTLLAYLQEVHKYFNETKLYPQLSDVIFHYNNIISFREHKKLLQDQFPKRLTGLEVNKLQVLYQTMIEDEGVMQELADIIDYAAQQMKRTIQDGAEIYEFVENKLNIEPVGIIPLENKEGYLFLSSYHSNHTWVYQYYLSFFERHDEKYRTIKTSYVDTWERSFVNTYQHIKSSLVQTRTDLPNPAVYVLETELDYPIEETLLPIAKRSLVRYITKA